jgi:sulfate adenylyltransferase
MVKTLGLDDGGGSIAIKNAVYTPAIEGDWMTQNHLPRPHGGRLIDRVLTGKTKNKAKKIAKELEKIHIDKETGIELGNIGKGVLSPLEGFMVREDYLNVVERKILTKGLPWTIPILLDVSKEEVGDVKEGDDVALLYKEEIVALMHIEDIYNYDKKGMAEKVFGTIDSSHPGVAKTCGMKGLLLGGRIDLVEEIVTPFQEYAIAPSITRNLFRAKGWKTVVGFQTRNIPHKGHECIQKTALSLFDGLFINPLLGRKKKGDFKDEVILDAYKALIKNYYPMERVIFGVLQTEMRYAGPREAIHHAIMRKNFGCTHFIVGRDHAGIGDYYSPYAAQEAFAEFPDLGITPILFPSFYYCSRCLSIVNARICPHGSEYHMQFSGTKIRQSIVNGEKVPSDFVRPEVGEVIARWRQPLVEED